MKKSFNQGQNNNDKKYMVVFSLIKSCYRLQQRINKFEMFLQYICFTQNNWTVKVLLNNKYSNAFVLFAQEITCK